MTKNIILINALFAAGILVFLCCVEFTIRHIPNDHSIKRKALEEQCATIETLVLGNSHALFGVNTDLIGVPALNAANVSQTLEFDSFILDTYIEKMGALKKVLIPISYFSLYMKLSESAEAWRIKNYRIYWGYSALYPLRNNLEILSGRMGRQLKNIWDYYSGRKSAQSCSPTGFGLSYHHDLRAKDWARSGGEAATRHTIRTSQSTVDENIGFLKDIINRCRERKIEVVIFMPPAWSSYTDRLDQGQLRNTLLVCEDLGRQDGVSFINLLKDPQFVEADFFDADHLNDLGAVKLTKLLSGK